MVAKQSAGTKPKPAAAVDAAGTAKAPLKPKESIKVFARFRPLEPGAELAPWDVGEKTLSVPDTARSTFTCRLDEVFDESHTQEEVYTKTCKPGVLDFTSGVNATIFAYGQTGTGKTYSMYGPDEVLHDIEGAPRELHGCALRAVIHIFDHLKQRPGASLKVSLLEVYNDMINDLTPGADGGAKADRQDLRLREHASEGVFVDGLKTCLLYTSPSPRDGLLSRMPSSA